MGVAFASGAREGVALAGAEAFAFSGMVKEVGMIGFVGCGASVLVCPNDNFGEVILENAEGGLVWGAGLAVRSSPPNADDKSPRALILDPEGASPTVPEAIVPAAIVPDAAVTGCALGAAEGPDFTGAYNFNIEFFKSFREVGRPSPPGTGALCVLTGESNSKPKSD